MTWENNKVRKLVSIFNIYVFVCYRKLKWSQIFSRCLDTAQTAWEVGPYATHTDLLTNNQVHASRKRLGSYYILTDYHQLVQGWSQYEIVTILRALFLFSSLVRDPSLWRPGPQGSPVSKYILSLNCHANYRWYMFNIYQFYHISDYSYQYQIVEKKYHEQCSFLICFRK